MELNCSWISVNLTTRCLFELDLRTFSHLVAAFSWPYSALNHFLGGMVFLFSLGWDVTPLVSTGLCLTGLVLALSFVVVFVAVKGLNLTVSQLEDSYPWLTLLNEIAGKSPRWRRLRHVCLIGFATQWYFFIYNWVYPLLFSSVSIQRIFDGWLRAYVGDNVGICSGSSAPFGRHHWILEELLSNVIVEWGLLFLWLQLLPTRESSTVATVVSHIITAAGLVGQFVPPLLSTCSESVVFFHLLERHPIWFFSLLVMIYVPFLFVIELSMKVPNDLYGYVCVGSLLCGFFVYASLCGAWTALMIAPSIHFQTHVSLGWWLMCSFIFCVSLFHLSSIVRLLQCLWHFYQRLDESPTDLLQRCLQTYYVWLIDNPKLKNTLPPPKIHALFKECDGPLSECNVPKVNLSVALGTKVIKVVSLQVKKRDIEGKNSVQVLEMSGNVLGAINDLSTTLGSDSSFFVPVSIR